MIKALFRLLALLLLLLVIGGGYLAYALLVPVGKNGIPRACG